MDTNPEQRQSKQPVGQSPYIGEEALRTLARMIARRLLAEPKYGVGMLCNVQPGGAPKMPEEALTDLTNREE